ncbi:HAD family hydrolase [Corynebacterium sp. SCR221107]|uniref:HAD-IIB family hydrolase n=1 Tax=Corynebacterium sp. SCR221107 TaxID=3017361 RepID=UPI0022EC6BB9|nr:HAD family hydrolase [Corynebacterium sp. SCR221107]WBT08958.1 HAD family hydrolase [Corynebacterium sp. SCR221107]
MPRKLISIDLDGTIVFERKVDPDAVAAIREWQAAGHLAVCNTGKSIAATKHALAESGLEFDYYVLYTGAVVTDSNYEVMMSNTLPNEVVSEIAYQLRDTDNLAVFATTLDTPDLRLSSTIDPSKSTSILQTFEPLEFSEIPKHSFVGIPLWLDETDAKIDALREQILGSYPEVLDCHRNQNFLDIVPPNCTKATGLEWLLPHLGGDNATTFETYSLGDSWNDLDMHHWADHAICFPYSPAEVKAATEQVTPTAAEFIRKALQS